MEKKRERESDLMGGLFTETKRFMGSRRVACDSRIRRGGGVFNFLTRGSVAVEGTLIFERQLVYTFCE